MKMMIFFQTMKGHLPPLELNPQDTTLLHRWIPLKDETTLEENKISRRTHIFIMLSKPEASSSGASAASAPPLSTRNLKGNIIRSSHKLRNSRMDRKTNTSDLLTWSEAPPSGAAAASSAARPNQPSDGMGKVLFGGQITQEESESLNKRKPCSGYKLKEMTGSKIFAAGGEDDTTISGTPDGNFNNRTSVRIVQQATNGISQISFSTEEKVSPKKPITIPEVAKQRELSGTLESDSESRIQKQISNAKSKELSGNDIFGPPPEIPPRSLAAARTMEIKESKDMGEPAVRNIRTSVKVSNPAGGHSNILFGDEAEVKSSKKIHDQKFAELTGNNIFKGDVQPGSAEKALSVAKLKEMSGSDIFADGKAKSRDYFGGVRKPPGGESTISLV